jgi:predicted Zn-dependent protease
VVQEDVYNAFAGPGGFVYFNSGLIAALDAEEELAGIVAHEIAHVDSRHISERIERSKKINTAMMAGLLASVLLGGAGAATAASALGVGSMAAGQSASLAYSRQDEIEADKKGLKYMREAGYDIRGLLNALNTIRSKQWFGREQIPTYLMTHPAVEDRLIYIGAVLGDSEAAPRVGPVRTTAFDVAKARIIALYSDPENSLLRLKNDITREPDDSMAQYGYGLALARKGELADAVNHLEAAAVLEPDIPIVLADLGRVYFLAGQTADARDVLTAVTRQDPDTQEAHYYLARTYLQLGLLGDAIAAFERAAELDPRDDDTQFYMGEAYYRLGEQLYAHYHLGKAYFLRRSLRSAEFHLQRARQLEPPADILRDIEDMMETIKAAKTKKKRK